MEDCIRKTVLSEERQRGKNKNITVDVHVLRKEENHEVFIQKILETLNLFRNTNSASQKDKDRGYYIFYCIRSGNPNDGSYKTAGCMAYTSFKIKDDWLSHKVIVQRTSKEHNGHNATCEKEGHFQAVCPDLRKQIEEWISLGVKPDIILLEAHKWSRSRGHTDLNNRQYFVTPKDIESIRTCLLRRSHLNKDDAISSAQLLTGQCKDNVVFFQPFTQENDLIIILQTPNMRDNLNRHGKNIIFLDATHCVNQYNFPLYTLAIRDDYGHGVPVAFIVTSNEKESTLGLALQQFRRVCPAPRCFMVDKDMCEINALRRVFPESDILLCWYHVMQAVVRWLSKTDSGVSGLSNTDVRTEIVSFIRKMKLCTTELDFKSTAEQFLKRFEDIPALCSYFKDHWLEIGNMWSDFGRCYNHADSDTNNLVERFFHRLKYQFLGGISLKSGQILQSASRLIEKGWQNNINLVSNDMYLYEVTSEQTTGLTYKVCPSESFCSCPMGIRGHQCKHLVLTDLLREHDSQKFPALDFQMNAHASVIKQNKLYSVLCFDTKEVDVKSLCNERIYHTSATTLQCTCCTYSHHEKCACLLLACELFDITLKTAATIDQDTSQQVNMDTAANPSKTEIQMLKEILETVQKWQSIPQLICHQIKELHDTVTNGCKTGPTCTEINVDLTRKIRPLFPHRAKNMKRRYGKNFKRLNTKAKYKS
ncbi:uncharacterized protein LOC130407814 isoform X4 [Triplophysa dalaica]|uniref:uncharacterized protein LOC130407814 isoform X4 n=1 Tax=Triplophysa dalaica TaxID=1582913 RepID=UPI0024DF7C66|nr:uncharacterized protein LOC130407814 isoform X4 [Triplophysa dalaica]